MTNRTKAPMTLEEQAARLVDAQASTILEGTQALITTGYTIVLAHDPRTGRVIVRVVNPRGQESTTRVQATADGLRNALAQVIQANQPGPVIAPASERSGR